MFIRTLEKRKKLLRNYTQNVDGIEKLAGISAAKLVECHGSMHGFHCSKCRKKGDYTTILHNLITNNELPICKCSNFMKPDIVFFGEALPSILEKRTSVDIITCDCVLVIGTSLKVGGSVVEFLKRLDPATPQILINRDQVGLPAKFSEGFDVSLLGSCDDVIEFLLHRLAWERTGKEQQSLFVQDRVFRVGSNSAADDAREDLLRPPTRSNKRQRRK